MRRGQRLQSKLEFNCNSVMRRTFQTSLAVAALAAGPCWADDPSPGPRFETYIGADYDGRAASLVSNTVWGVFGPVTQPGFRLKLDGLADVYGNSNAAVFSSSFMAADLKSVSDFMAGYQFQWGAAWIKLYAGAAFQVQTRFFWSVGDTANEQAIGAAAAIQSYWRVSDRVWASVNASWLQPDNATSLYSRAAYEIFRSDGGVKISAGFEASVSINNADNFAEGKALYLYDNYSREGTLLNLRYGRNDLSLSGGISEASGDVARPYATISYGRQF